MGQKACIISERFCIVIQLKPSCVSVCFVVACVYMCVSLCVTADSTIWVDDFDFGFVPSYLLLKTKQVLCLDTDGVLYQRAQQKILESHSHIEVSCGVVMAMVGPLRATSTIPNNQKGVSLKHCPLLLNICNYTSP